MTWVDRLADKATLASGLHLRRSEELRSWRLYTKAQFHRHHTTDRLEEGGIDRTRKGHHQSDQECWENFWEMDRNTHISQAGRYHLELNWTDLHMCVWFSWWGEGLEGKEMRNMRGKREGERLRKQRRWLEPLQKARPTAGDNLNHSWGLHITNSLRRQAEDIHLLSERWMMSICTA